MISKLSNQTLAYHSVYIFISNEIFHFNHTPVIKFQTDK